LLEELHKDEHRPHEDKKGKKHGLRNRGLKERQFGIPGTSPIGGGLPYCASGTTFTSHHYPYGACIVW